MKDEVESILQNLMVEIEKLKKPPAKVKGFPVSLARGFNGGLHAAIDKIHLKIIELKQ